MNYFENSGATVSEKKRKSGYFTKDTWLTKEIVMFFKVDPFDHSFVYDLFEIRISDVNQTVVPKLSGRIFVIITLSTIRLGQ